MSDNNINELREETVRSTLGAIVLGLIRRKKSVTVSYQRNVFGASYFLRCSDITSGNKTHTTSQTFTENQLVEVSDPEVIVDAITIQMK